MRLDGIVWWPLRARRRGVTIISILLAAAIASCAAEGTVDESFDYASIVREVEGLRIDWEFEADRPFDPSLSAQDPPPQEEKPAQGWTVGQFFVDAGDTLWTLGKNCVKDGLYLAASPLRINGETILPTLAVFGALGVAFALDKSVQEFSQNNRSRSTDDFFGTFARLGEDEELRAYIYAGTVGIGIIARENWIVEMGLTAFEADLYAGGLVVLLKKVTGRKRPSESRDSVDFTFWGKSHSFPSGHVIGVSPMMAVFSAYIDCWAFDLLAYSMITIASLNRINGNGHWLSDVVASDIIGIAVGRTLYELHRNPDLKIIPWVTPARDGEFAIGVGVILGR